MNELDHYNLEDLEAAYLRALHRQRANIARKIESLTVTPAPSPISNEVALERVLTQVRRARKETR